MEENSDVEPPVTEGWPPESDVVVFRCRKPPAEESNTACTIEECHCEVDSLCENLQKFCSALKEVAECRAKMCPFTILKCLSDSMFGVYFTWLELGDDVIPSYKEKTNQGDTQSKSACTNFQTEPQTPISEFSTSAVAKAPITGSPNVSLSKKTDNRSNPSLSTSEQVSHTYSAMWINKPARNFCPTSSESSDCIPPSIPCANYEPQNNVAEDGTEDNNLIGNIPPPSEFTPQTRLNSENSPKIVPLIRNDITINSPSDVIQNVPTNLSGDHDQIELNDYETISTGTECNDEDITMDLDISVGSALQKTKESDDNTSMEQNLNVDKTGDKNDTLEILNSENVAEDKNKDENDVNKSLQASVDVNKNYGGGVTKYGGTELREAAHAQKDKSIITDKANDESPTIEISNKVQGNSNPQSVQPSAEKLSAQRAIESFTAVLASEIEDSAESNSQIPIEICEDSIPMKTKKIRTNSDQINKFNKEVGLDNDLSKENNEEMSSESYSDLPEQVTPSSLSTKIKFERQESTESNLSSCTIKIRDDDVEDGEICSSTNSGASSPKLGNAQSQSVNKLNQDYDSDVQIISEVESESDNSDNSELPLMKLLERRKRKRLLDKSGASKPRAFTFGNFSNRKRRKEIVSEELPQAKKIHISTEDVQPTPSIRITFDKSKTKAFPNTQVSPILHSSETNMDGNVLFPANLRTPTKTVKWENLQQSNTSKSLASNSYLNELEELSNTSLESVTDPLDRRSSSMLASPTKYSVDKSLPSDSTNKPVLTSKQGPPAHVSYSPEKQRDQTPKTVTISEAGPVSIRSKKNESSKGSVSEHSTSRACETELRKQPKKSQMTFSKEKSSNLVFTGNEIRFATSQKSKNPDTACKWFANTETKIQDKEASRGHSDQSIPTNVSSASRDSAPVPDVPTSRSSNADRNASQMDTEVQIVNDQNDFIDLSVDTQQRSRHEVNQGRGNNSFSGRPRRGCVYRESGSTQRSNSSRVERTTLADDSRERRNQYSPSDTSTPHNYPGNFNRGRDLRRGGGRRGGRDGGRRGRSSGRGRDGGNRDRGNNDATAERYQQRVEPLRHQDWRRGVSTTRHDYQNADTNYTEEYRSSTQSDKSHRRNRR